MSTVYGYTRVSTKEQKEERQIEILLKYGVKENNIFKDKSSGRSLKRTDYLRLKKKIRAGDTIVFDSLDRLGRKYCDILNEWRDITEHRNVHIKVLDMPLLDTTTPNLTPMSIFIRDIVLHVYAFIAEQEWHNIKRRQAGGIAVAKLKGKHLGRPKKPYPKNFKKVYYDWLNGAISASNAMNLLGIKKSMFYQLAKSFVGERGSYEK